MTLNQLFLFSWTVLVVNGALPMIQLLILGRVPMPPSTPKLLLIAVAYIILLWRKKWQTPRAITSWVLVMAIYLFVCYFVWTANPSPEGYSLSGIASYYMGFVILALAFTLPGSLSSQSIALFLIVLSIPLDLLGISQYLSGESILPQSEDSGSSYSMVNSVNFHGALRGFSLFSSGLEFGNFVNLVSCILVAAIFLKRKGGARIRLGAFVALLLSACAVYSTLTRAVYGQFLLGITSAILFSRSSPARGHVLLFTLIFGGVGFSVIFAVPFVQSLLSSDLTSSGSLLMRLVEWGYYSGHLLAGDLTTLLFGTGLTQGGNVGDITIDNGPLAVAYQAGILGLILWLWGGYIVLRFVQEQLRANPLSALHVGVAAYVSTWLYICLWNTLPDNGARVAVLAALCAASAKRDELEAPLELKELR